MRSAGSRPSGEVEQRRQLVGFDRLVRDPKPETVIEQLLFTPTCNIAGVTTGYQGPGSKTVLPAEATAKLDFRLVPDQTPERVRRLFEESIELHEAQEREALRIGDDLAGIERHLDVVDRIGEEEQLQRPDIEQQALARAQVVGIVRAH